jgi:hypothetical protein
VPPGDGAAWGRCRLGTVPPGDGAAWGRCRLGINDERLLHSSTCFPKGSASGFADTCKRKVCARPRKTHVTMRSGRLHREFRGISGSSCAHWSNVEEKLSDGLEIESPGWIVHLPFDVHRIDLQVVSDRLSFRVRANHVHAKRQVGHVLPEDQYQDRGMRLGSDVRRRQSCRRKAMRTSSPSPPALREERGQIRDVGAGFMPDRRAKRCAPSRTGRLGP